MDTLEFGQDDKVIILGATGFVGSRLARELYAKGVALRLLDRNVERAAALAEELSGAKPIYGDLVTAEGLDEALDGVHTAYYLVHSMGGTSGPRAMEFIERDRKAAGNFVAAADKAGLRRVIYLGGLGEVGKDLSEHLKSRAEVADMLSSGKAKATVLRAAVIIGAGGASFEILRYLVERLPVMITPRWLNTRIQPIAIRDVIAYLTGCLFEPATAGERFDIGGPEVMTYRMMMDAYAEARGLAKRLILTVPVLTPSLSAYWVDLVTPVPSGVAHPLIEGMKNEVVCRDSRIDELVHIEKTPFVEAVRIAVSQEKEGPGIKGF
jgi:uncharacterized protein YbjT (DUF2867 family)